MPWGSDNALVKAAEAVRRLASFRPATQITDIWRGQVKAMHISEEEKAVLLDPQQVWDALDAMPVEAARGCHALTHTTISPNVIHPVESQKTNVIPDVVDLVVDIRTLPGTTEDEVIAMITEALGDLAPHIEIGEAEQQAEGTQSSIDTPLWDVISHQTQIAYPGAELLPGLVVGGTDARVYRQRGRIGYGAGLFSPSIDMATFGNRFHGHNERIDVESLGLATDFWLGVCQELLG
jgi:acetylornithine deacetylase/succinyl-diaminopimelate desuccinylase-like protein